MKSSDRETNNDMPAVSIEECRLRLGKADQEEVVFCLDKLVVGRGEQAACTGPSGCGKSTLLNLIAGMLKPDCGRIFVEGVDITSLPASRCDTLRGHMVGFVHQSLNLLEGFTAMENVLVGMRYGRVHGRNRREHAARLLLRVGLSRRMNAYPTSMSVGERQRVAIARAVANNPNLLLADEPTGSLDPAYAASVIDLMKEVAEEYECTLLVVTHDMDVASRFTRRIDCRNLIVHEGVEV